MSTTVLFQLVVDLASSSSNGRWATKCTAVRTERKFNEKLDEMQKCCCYLLLFELIVRRLPFNAVGIGRALKVD